MKKILVIALAIGLVLSLSGCVKINIEQKICADGTIHTVIDEKYHPAALEYMGLGAEELFQVPADQIPTETINGELYYVTTEEASSTLGEFYQYIDTVITEEIASTVNFEFKTENGVEYCTIELTGSDEEQSVGDAVKELKALDDPSMDSKGLDEIQMTVAYSFENGLVEYSCDPENEEAIEADGNTVRIDFMKLGSGAHIRITGIVGPVAPEEGQPFTDVRTGSYYADAVKWALANNVTKGTSATTFSPAAECNRAQVVTFLWNAAGQPEPLTSVNPFTDVSPADWYYKAVLWAVENKITSGTSLTTFSPRQLCQNSHIVTFLWNANGKPGKTEAPEFWYSDAYDWAAEAGLLDGVPSVSTPEGNCPRSNIVMLLMKQYSK